MYIVNQTKTNPNVHKNEISKQNIGELYESSIYCRKPSVAAEFAKALKLKTTRRDGYMESENAIVTWCVGHLVTMSYPECYDENTKMESQRFAIYTSGTMEV